MRKSERFRDVSETFQQAKETFERRLGKVLNNWYSSALLVKEMQKKRLGVARVLSITSSLLQILIANRLHRLLRNNSLDWLTLR